MAHKKFHGLEVEEPQLVPFSKFYKGKFGRLFRKLPPLKGWSKSHFKHLANSMFRLKSEEESTIPAGYTYLGQFINHDITFDPTSELGKQNDPERINNFRTPRFDLDSVYGRGPLDAPYMYQTYGMKFIIEKVTLSNDDDVLRKKVVESNIVTSRQRAILGDQRNDENLIIGQLHLAFMKFHNRVVDKLLLEIGKPAKELQPTERRKIFVDAQKETRFHYQWLVIYDFLNRIVGKAIVDDILSYKTFVVGRTVELTCEKQSDLTEFKVIPYETKFLKPNLVFYDWKYSPFLPVEFSVAAFRIGHSMVRPNYALNRTISNVPIFNFESENLRKANKNRKLQSQVESVKIFLEEKLSDLNIKESDRRSALVLAGVLSGEVHRLDSKSGNVESTEFEGENIRSLLGFHERPANWTIEWDRFFDYRNNENKLQFAQKINTRLAKPLQNLPFEDIGSLAFRNLFRGDTLGLPSGQSIAHAMGLPDDLILPKFGESKEITTRCGKTSITLLPQYITKRLPANSETPLWYYILKEAEEFMEGKCLGPVGGRIVAEVLIGLLIGDPNSYINENINWSPEDSLLGKEIANTNYTMAEFLIFAEG